MGKIECDVEYKIHDFLNQLKKDKPMMYEQAKRVLRYLYKTVKNDYFEYYINLQNGKEKEAKVEVITRAEKNLFDYYINGQDGILDNFIKLCNDEPKYFDKFLEGIDTFLEMSENHLFSNYEVYKYVFNMYAMLKTYQVCQDDYETFAKTVDELSNFFITSTINSNLSFGYGYSHINHEFVSKKELIDRLIDLRNYKDTPLVSRNLKQILDEINENYSGRAKKKYIEVIKYFEKLYRAIAEEEKREWEINPKTVAHIETELEEILEICKNLHNNSDVSTWPINYFSPIVLIGERYDFLKTTLNAVEPTPKYQIDILNSIEKLDNQFFEFLNSEVSAETDSFITCMKMVFDSDTYYELLGKLNSIKKANAVYKKDPKLALHLIKRLNSDDYKEEIDGVKLAWPKNTSLNKVEKPKTILGRTIALHKALDYAPSESYYREKVESHYYAMTIAAFVSEINGCFRLNKIKAMEAVKKEQEEQALVAIQEPEVPKKTKGLGSIFSPFNKGNNSNKQ